MSATSEIKFELYIDSTSTGDTANLNPEDMTDVGLNEGITINESGGGITFDGAGNIKCGKTGYDVGIGWWLGFDEAARKCRVAIGDPNNEKVTWDGQDLVIDIDGTNLSVNGGNTGQVLKVASNGTIEFGDKVENLDDLGDVTGTTHTSGTFKVLIPKTGNVYGFEDLRSVTSSYVRLQDLSNVTNTAPTANGLILRYNSSAQRWEYDTAADVGGDISIGNLSDVGITSIADDQVLQYNSATARFENVDMTTAIGNQGLGDHTDVSLTQLQVTSPKVLWQHPSYNSGNWVAKVLSLHPDVFKNVEGTLGDGKVLVYNVPGGATDPHWLIKDRTDLLSLNDLQNVSAATPAVDSFLQYNGTNWVATSRSMFSTIAVSGQSNVVADSPTDTLTLAAGTGITLTTDANNDTITIASSGGGGGNKFTRVGVSGQTTIEADATTDILNVAAGTGITLTTDASTDTLTISASGGGSGSSDVIQDADGDTKVQVEAATDNDEVRLIQAGNQLLTLRSSKVGLGTFSSNPQYMVDMREGSLSAQMRLLTLGTSTNTILRNEIGGTTGSNFIYFGDSADDDVGKIEYNHTDNAMIFNTNATEQMRISDNGEVGIGRDPAYELDIETDTGDAVLRLRTTATGSSDDTFLRMQVGGTTADNWVYFGDADDSNVGQIGYQHGSNRFRFFTDAQEALRINSDQSLELYGGLKFAATSSNSGALDDYEEGTWTPHFADAASGGNYVTASTAGTGSYTKIGDIVHVSCPAQNINPSGLNSSNFLYIRNLPFTVASTYLQFPSTSINFTGRAANSMLGAYLTVNPGSTYGFVILPSSTGGGENMQTVGNILRTTQTSNAYTGVRFSITYKTA